MKNALITKMTNSRGPAVEKHWYGMIMCEVQKGKI